jgi:hypothetical protein
LTDARPQVLQGSLGYGGTTSDARRILRRQFAAYWSISNANTANVSSGMKRLIVRAAFSNERMASMRGQYSGEVRV